MRALSIETCGLLVQGGGMGSSTKAGATRNGFANILRNLAWLLGGKGVGAVASIIYLAILSRSLGLKEFGHFALIFGTGQALVAVAGFQTWQTIVRYGAGPLHLRDWPKFGRLAWLCSAIDLSGAIVGTLMAVVIYYGFGGALELNPEYIDIAFAFNVALLWSRMTTPNGIVRVMDRFDLSTYIEAVVPAGRLLASFAILLIGPTVGKFLFAWAFFDLLVGLIYWIVAWRLVPDALHRDHFGQWRAALRENAGLRRFFGVTYASSTLDALYKQGPLLAVGYFLGTSAAGLYRLADQLAQGIGKLSQLIARAVFPEFVMTRAAHPGADFARLVKRVSVLAASGGVVVTLVALFAGETVLGLIGGKQFAGGAAILVPIAIGASFELAAVTYEPVLYSTGHARIALLARCAALLALVLGIMTMVSLGPIGVGWAVAIGMAIFYLVLNAAVWTVLAKERREA